MHYEVPVARDAWKMDFKLFSKAPVITHLCHCKFTGYTTNSVVFRTSLL